MLGKSGKPLKYANLLRLLRNSTLYAAVSISQLALERGYVDLDDPDYDKKIKRIRVSCYHIARKYGFPLEGDGMITIKGQKRIVAWYGWRWKDALKVKAKARAKAKAKARRLAKKKAERMKGGQQAGGDDQ